MDSWCDTWCLRAVHHTVTHNSHGCPAEVVCGGRSEVNKAQLIDALAERIGDRKVAGTAVAALLDLVVRTVNSGERVTITGFGVFEKRARAARTARNPRTGQTVTVRQTDVPVFRPGTLFREVVSGTRVLAEAGGTFRAVASSSPQTGPAPVETAASAASRPATRVTPAARLAAAHAAPAKGAKAPKAAKPAKMAKAAKAAKPAKAAKAEPKTKGNTPGPAKATAKKAGKKSASKK